MAKRRALLIFADSAHADCKRRGWPSAFRILLETQSFLQEGIPSYDLHLFTSRALYREISSSTQLHFQEGASFGQRLENAIESLTTLGYEEIVIVGRDCPDLEPSDIRDAFALLEQYRLVLGPDHRGGCYLIGLHANDTSRLNGVQWQRNTDHRQIRRRFAADAVAELPVKFDLDTWEDVRLLADSRSAFRWLARTLLDSVLALLPTPLDSASARDSDRRISWQLPPPLLV